MGIAIQVLRDADNVDHGPLMDFCQWAREHDGNGFFAAHYQWQDSQSDIMDLGSLHGELQDYFDGITEADFKVPPPDIRAWLADQIEKDNVLAWVSW